MILPGKHLKQDRALLGVGAVILDVMEEGQTVSEVWEKVQKHRDNSFSTLSFDWFALSLSFLYAIGVVEYDQGILIIKE